MLSSIDNFSQSFNTLGVQNNAVQGNGFQGHESALSQVNPNGEDDPSLNKVKKSEQSKQGLSFSEKSDKTEKTELSEEDLKKIEELKKRDAEVHTHEQAHLSAAGSLSNGAASFDYETGPDGKRYAVGGEVSIDTAKVEGDPQATIEKSRQIRRAALAPAQPSGQDRQVAAQASQMEIDANKEIASEKDSQAGSLDTLSEVGVNGASRSNSNSQTDFYKNIQTASSSNNSGVSMLDYYV